MRLYSSNANQSRSAARYARLHRPMSTVSQSSKHDGAVGSPGNSVDRKPAGSGRKVVGSWLKVRLRLTG
jgi:hypothetical protein